MAPKPLTFRARNLVQALLSIKKAGLPIASVEIKDGKVVINIGKPAATSANEEGADEWEKRLAELNDWDEVFTRPNPWVDLHKLADPQPKKSSPTAQLKAANKTETPAKKRKRLAKARAKRAARLAEKRLGKDKTNPH